MKILKKGSEETEARRVRDDPAEMGKFVIKKTSERVFNSKDEKDKFIQDLEDEIENLSDNPFSIS